MARNTSPHHLARRHVTVDGIRYSLESGRKLRHIQPTGTKPSSHTTARHTESDPTAMHPHQANHPILPLPTSRQHSNRHISAWQVITRSLHQKQDRRAFDAALIISLLSPAFWFCAALPWGILGVIQSQNLTVQQGYSLIRGFLIAPYNRIVLIVALTVVALFIVWLIRHVLQLVGYAANLRHIDHRSVDTKVYGWQAIAKSYRLLVITLLDILLSAVSLGGLVMITLKIMSIQTARFVAYQGLIVYFVLLFFLFILAILAVHRALTRVMLAATNQSTSFLIVKSLGLSIKSPSKTLWFGLFWLLSALVTGSLIFAIIWSTTSYGQFTVGRNNIARAGLTLLSTFLLYATIVGYTVWSQGYWPLVYHHLAHINYRSAVSQLIVTRPHVKPRRSAILQVAVVMIGAGISVVIALSLLKTPTQRFFTSLQERLPENISDFIAR